MKIKPEHCQADSTYPSIMYKYFVTPITNTCINVLVKALRLYKALILGSLIQKI